MNAQQPLRILYIDDSAHDRALVRDALEIEHGSFRVTETTSRAEFEAQLAHGDFDLVLTDFNILGYDGLQVLDAVKANNPRLPVLIVTGTGSEEIAVEAMKRGAADYVIKTPQHIQRLPVTIQSVITRHHAEMRLARVSRARAMMAECNQVLVRTTEEAQLLREMCRIVVEAGGYRMAWIGFAENDVNQSVLPVAHAGIEEGYLATVKITWADNDRGRGPTGSAIRSGKPVVARYIRANPDFAPWREEALKRGYGSNLALPLGNGSGAIGVLGIYAGEADAFDTEEVALLEELADDIGYGIGSLRARVARAQAEANLLASQQRLAGILNIAEDAIISVDQNHRIILFNQGAEKIFGYRPHEALGQPLDLLLPQRFHESHGRHITEFAGSPETARRMATRSEVFGRRKDSSEFPAEASISKFELGGGKVFTVMLRDITARKQAEAERKRLLDVLEASLNEIYIFNPDTLRFWYVNQGALRNLGYSADAVQAMTPLDLKPEFTAASFRELVAPLLRGKREVIVFQTTHRRADGTLYPVEVHLQLVGQELQRAFLAVIFDITERSWAERALRDYAGQLRLLSRRLFEAEESERRRLARELHDRIGQNVTALSLNLNLVRSELPADVLQKMSPRLNDCESLLYYTAQLVRDIQVDLRPPGLDEFGLVAALNENARQVAGRSGFNITVVGTEIAPRLTPAMEITLFRIVQEALNNIAKHAQATEVTITVKANPEEVIVTIADNGRGFDPAARPAQPMRSLGMVSMRERAESMGGTLRIESAPGQGARVSVEAPRAAPANHSPSPSTGEGGDGGA